ncbi:RecB family exonuclease [Acinetobacter sp.]|uniref:RecB family exonuclease n=1 Tax=Acinetobacter sp. TaxID=472 RepID=UPI003D03F4A2
MSELWLPKPHLSISQIKSMEFCERKYYFQSVEGVKSDGIAPVFGGIAHAALEFNYANKITTGHDLPVSVVQKHFRDNFLIKQKEVTDWEGRNPADVLKLGEAFVAFHMLHMALTIPQPTAVEQSFETIINGVKLVGFADLLTDSTVYDHKFSMTPGKQKLNVDTDMQLSLYAKVFNKEKVGFNLHWLGDNGKPAGTTVTSIRGLDDFKKLDEAVTACATKIDANKNKGDFPKTAFACKGKKSGWVCEFYDLCWSGHKVPNKATDERVWNTLNGFEKRRPADVDNADKDKVFDDLLKIETTYETVELPF